MKIKKAHCMYILRNGATNQYKIGITNDLNRRLIELQTGCPGLLSVIKIYTHPKRQIIEKYERIVQRYYTRCGCRIRSNGEWFTLTKADINFLCKPQTIAEQNNIMETLLNMM